MRQQITERLKNNKHQAPGGDPARMWNRNKKYRTCALTIAASLHIMAQAYHSALRRRRHNNAAQTNISW